MANEEECWRARYGSNGRDVPEELGEARGLRRVVPARR
jgi:hypothetical protein